VAKAELEVHCDQVVAVVVEVLHLMAPWAEAEEAAEVHHSPLVEEAEAVEARRWTSVVTAEEEAARKYLQLRFLTAAEVRPELVEEEGEEPEERDLRGAVEHLIGGEEEP
jgi:hypothetical protein